MEEVGRTFVVISFEDLVMGEQGAVVDSFAGSAAMEATVSLVEIVIAESVAGRVATEAFVEVVVVESFATAMEVAESFAKTVTVIVIKTLASVDS